MKNLISVALLSLFLLSSHAVLGADKKIDPNQFPLAVHVSASTYPPQSPAWGSPIAGWYEIITATINGKHYQLQGPTSNPKAQGCCNGLIDPGDYRGRLVKNEHITTYESLQEFEILFPDGTTRRFDVIAQSE